MNDKQKLEIITEVIAQYLILYPFRDQSYYVELAERIKTLIAAEIKAQNDHEYNKQLMSFWGPTTN